MKLVQCKSFEHWQYLVSFLGLYFLVCVQYSSWKGKNCENREGLATLITWMTSGGFFINCSRWHKVGQGLNKENLGTLPHEWHQVAFLSISVGDTKLGKGLRMRLCLSLVIQFSDCNWTYLFDLLNCCPAVPIPTISAEIVGEAVEGNRFAVSCYATVVAGLPTNSVQIRYLNSFGFEISNSSSRVVVTPVIQLNETTFVRTVSLNPILTNDTGNYSCVAVVEGAYHTSGVTFLNTSLVVQRK